MYELLLLGSNLQTLLNMPTLIHPVHSVDGRNSLYSELHTKCCKPTCWHCVNRCWLVMCHYQWRCHTYRQCPHHPLSAEPCTVSTTPALKSPQSTTSSGLGVGVRVCAGVVNIGMMSAWVGVHVQQESPQSMPVISSSFHMTFGQMRQPIKPSKHSPLPYWELHGVCMSHILSDSGRQPVEEYTLWVTSEVKTHIALYIQVPVARSLPVSTVRSLHAWLYVYVRMCPYTLAVYMSGHYQWQSDNIQWICRIVQLLGNVTGQDQSHSMLGQARPSITGMVFVYPVSGAWQWYVVVSMYIILYIIYIYILYIIIL